MSRCYYLRIEDNVNLEALQDMLQQYMHKGFMVKAKMFSDEYGARFYIENKAARGVEVYRGDENIVVKIPILSNYADYLIGRLILDALFQVFKTDVTDDEGSVINVCVYFTDENINDYRNQDSQIFLTVLLNIAEKHIAIQGVNRLTYFGRRAKKELAKFENNLDELTNRFEATILFLQYGLSSYEMPGAALMSSQKNPDEKPKKLRIVFSGYNYLLQDYDFLLISDDLEDGNVRPILIDNDDLKRIMPRGWYFADDFTVVAPALTLDEWREFVKAARTRHHAEVYGGAN